MPRAKESEVEIEFIPYHKRQTPTGDFKNYVWFKQYNLLPDPGTWQEQDVRFIKVVEWCEMVHSKWAKWQQAKNDATAALTQQLQSVMK